MSKDAVFELLKAIEQDDDLRARLEQDLAKQDQPLNAFVATSGEAGYAFTGDEFIAAMDELEAGAQNRQLSDNELDGVVAGLTISSTVGSTANRLFRRYRAGPTAGSIRPGTPVLEEEEELIQG